VFFQPPAESEPRTITLGVDLVKVRLERGASYQTAMRLRANARPHRDRLLWSANLRGWTEADPRDLADTGVREVLGVGRPSRPR
jgi:hypothetical protein